ncbi:MAG: DinB family protein [Chloroflexi bacterium]|nr:DinB family protein [Chloroflexota bacterium]
MSVRAQSLNVRAEALAERFEVANSELITVIERCTESQWQAHCTPEGWSVGVTAHHLAVDHPILAGAVQAVATGQPLPPLTSAAIDQMNAEHAAQRASYGKNETLELLRSGGAAAASAVRALGDEQLDRVGTIPWEGDRPVSAQQLIEEKLIGHISEHLESIRAALQRP